MKVRLPKGVGGGPQNMDAMMRQVQKFQEEREALAADLESREYDVAAEQLISRSTAAFA